MRIESRLLAAILVLLFAIGLDVAPASGQEKKSIRFVTVSLGWNSALPFRVTIARGLFKQQGLQVEPILIRGGPAAIAALASGEVDLRRSGGSNLYLMHSRTCTLEFNSTTSCSRSPSVVQ